MNNVWKRLTVFGATGIIQGTPQEKKARPYTLAFRCVYENNELIDIDKVGDLPGDVRDFSMFHETANVLNVVHKNGRTTVVRKAAALSQVTTPAPEESNDKG